MLTPIDYLDQLVGYRPKRQGPEFPAGGAVWANPGLLPPGAEVYEDGSYRLPSEIAPYPPGLMPQAPDVTYGGGAEELLPGLFGGGNGGFEPSGPPIPITGPMPPPPEGPFPPPTVKPIAFG